MKFIIGLIFLPIAPLFRFFLNRVDMIEKSRIEDKSILILKDILYDSKNTQKT